MVENLSFMKAGRYYKSFLYYFNQILFKVRIKTDISSQMILQEIMLKPNHTAE